MSFFGIIKGAVSAFRWSPLWALAGAFLLLVLANLVVFGARGPTGLDNLVPLESWLIDDPVRAGPADQGAARSVMALRDASGRLNWLMTGLVQTVILLGAVWYFSSSIWDTLRENGCSNPRAVVQVIFGTLILSGALIAGLDRLGLALDKMMGSGLAYTGILHEMMRRHSPFRISPWLSWVVQFSNGLAVGVTVLGTLAACVTIAIPRADDEALIRDRIDRLRRLTTVGAIVLISAVIQIGAEYRWPAAVFREKILAAGGEEKGSLPLVETLSNYASAVTLTAGGAFTFFMIAAFGTSFLILDRSASAAAAGPAARHNLSVDLWRKQVAGTSLSWTDIYADISKIMGPLFVAALGAYIKF